ncbi:MAG: dihydroorotate dehydrogenase [Candidatus Kariarchaeaceae archaeon]
MTVYKFTYHNIIRYLPEYFIEQSGGWVVRFMSHLTPKTTPQIIKYSGLSFSAPWGLASGWADDLNKMYAANRLGAGAIISKTITLHPKKGNTYPRIVRGRRGMINSMGLPNKGLNYWMYQLDKIERLPNNFFLSIKGETVQQWSYMINKLERYTNLLELNFSCPNVQDGIIDLHKTSDYLLAIRKKESTAQLFLKLSPQYNNEMLLELIDLCIDKNLIDGITLFNTLPVTHSRLGNPDKSGGLSGPSLYPRLLESLRVIREQYSSPEELPIFALGGITTYPQAEIIYSKYNAIPFIMTAFLMEGPQIFHDWKKQQIIFQD